MVVLRHGSSSFLWVLASLLPHRPHLSAFCVHRSPFWGRIWLLNMKTCPYSWALTSYERILKVILSSSLIFLTIAWMLKFKIVKVSKTAFFFCLWPADNFKAGRKSKYIFLQSDMHKDISALDKKASCFWQRGDSLTVGVHTKASLVYSEGPGQSRAGPEKRYLKCANN